MEDEQVAKPQQKLRWYQFSLRTLLLLFIPAALIGYFFKPGHLISGKVTVEFTLERFKYLEYRTSEDGPIQRALVAEVRVKNKSDNPLWYLGQCPEYPAMRYTFQLIKGKWESYGNGITDPPGHKIYFEPGESFVCEFPVYEGSKSLKVGLSFASKWFGDIDKSAFSDEIKVETSVSANNATK